MDIRAATPEQAELFTEWAVREGWGAGVGDGDVFYNADPGGFLIAWDRGVPVGSVSAVRYDADYAFIGFYIVDPALRGQGIGHQLFDAALERVGAATSGLDGVMEQVPAYASLGYAPAHVTTRYVGSPEAISAVPVRDTGFARAVTYADVESVIDFDARHTPARRERFMRGWLDHDSARRSFVVTTGNEIQGLATVRPALGGGSRIGPLFAVDADVAHALLSICASAAKDYGGSIAIDIPEPNTAAITLAQDMGLAPSFACTRMYRGSVQDLPIERIWGNTTFELG